MNVRTARPEDVPFVLQMMREESNAVGFVPRARMAWEVQRGRVLLAHAGRMKLGYAYVGSPASGVLPIYQTVTEAGVRRTEIGLAMVRHAGVIAAAAGAWGLECGCRDELAANAFWRAAGFEVRETRGGGSGRGRNVNIYYRRF